MNFDVVGLGSCGVDLRARVPILPTADRKIATESAEITGGGVTANNLFQTARLGLKTAWLGALGEDQWADYLRDQFTSEKIEAFANVPKGSLSQQVWIVTDAKGDTAMTIVMGASKKLTPEVVTTKFAETIRSSKHLHLEVSVTPLSASLEAARIAHADGIRVIVDVDSDPWYLIREERIGTTEELQEILRLSYAAKFSQGAARGYLKTDTLTTDSVALLLQSGAQMVAVTLAEEGCFIGTHEKVTAVKGFPISVIDPVGAGDAFMGGLSYGILQGWDLEHIGRFANACGASKCEHAGARGSVSLSEVEAFLVRYA